MATPPTRVLYAVPSTGNYTSTTSPKTTTSFNVTAGDIIVVMAGSENSSTLASVTPSASGGSVTWTLRAQFPLTTSGQTSTTKCWTGVVGATATGITVSLASISAAGDRWGMSATLVRNHGGVGVVFQAGITAGNGAPAAAGRVSSADATAANCGANSLVLCVVNDWNAVDGTTRTWRTINGAAETETVYSRTAGAHTAYGGYRADTGAAGAITQGLTVPSTMRWSLSGVEILGVTASAPQGGATGAISWVGVATGKKNPQAGATGAIAHVSTATGKKNPLGNGSSIIGWMSAGTGKLEPKGAASGSISWVGFAIGQKIMGGNSSGSMTRVSSPATGVKNPQGSVAGSITWVAVAVGKKEPEGSATGVFTHVGLATGSTPGEAMQGAAIGSIVWTGVASGRKMMNGAAAGSMARVGTASGKRELTGFAAGSIAWVGMATGSQPGVPPAEGSAVSFIDWIGSASGKLSPIGSGVGSIGRAGVSTGKSIPLGSAVGLIDWVGLATGTKTGFYHVTVLSVTEKSTYKAGVVLMPSYFITVEDTSTTVKVKELNQDITVEEVE